MLTVIPYLTLSLLVIAALGGLTYYLIALVTIRQKYLVLQTKSQAPMSAELPPVSLLKPLHGADPNLAFCLKSFFQQNYPAFEILFAVRGPDDPAVAVVNELQKYYPHVPTQLIYTGEPP